ncbi:MAG: acetyl-CoA acetyltransferase [Dehalococcoidia bacterium]
MSEKVAIVGVGHTAFRSISPDVSFKELMYEAAVKAYDDAGVDPRKDIDSFVCLAEDFLEGRSISDIHMPDQIGAVLRPVHTICADGIYGLIAAYMQIRTGQMDIIAVEAHSKASNLLTPDWCLAFALDPVLNRPLGQNAHFVAGMEMNRYLHDSGTTKEQCALVSVKNRMNALSNPSAAYSAQITVEDVLNSEMMFYPLSRLDMAPLADGAIVMVLASEEKAKSLSQRPVWVKGVGWCSDSPSLETREWGQAVYAELAAQMAYRMARMKNPREEIDLVEVDDSLSFKELQHLEALGLCRKGEAGAMVEEGATQKGGELPTNLSGGNLGVGHLGEASGLQRALEIVLQLRGEAGRRQLPHAETGLAQSWRGIPTTSGAVIILSRKE